MGSSTGGEIGFLFRRPRFPMVYAMRGNVLAARSPAALRRQLGGRQPRGAGVLDMVDATGEGWAYHPDLMVVSPLTLEKRWKKIAIVRLFNESENARVTGVVYPEARIPRRSLVRIIAEIAALAERARPDAPPHRTGARRAGRPRSPR